MEFVDFDCVDFNKFEHGSFPANADQCWEIHDSEERFDQNFKNENSRNILTAAGWSKNSIRYQTNSHGFRMVQDMNRIIPNQGNMYLGCSITFGIGLNIEDTWAWKLNQKIGGDFINLSWPGGGIEAQYRMLKIWAERTLPKRAYTIGSFVNRRELLSNDGKIIRIGPWMSDLELKLNKHLISDDEIKISFIRTIDAMTHVCAINGIELYAPDTVNLKDLQLSEKDDLPARDLTHRGKNWHSRLADKPHNWWKRLV